MLARWSHAYPESPALQALAGRLGQGGLDLDEVFALSLVQGDGAITVSDPANRLFVAERASRLYEQYYHHGAPPSREVVVALWELCEQTPELVDACRTRRAEAERRLGPLR
jgi:hypothetical protein